MDLYLTLFILCSAAGLVLVVGSLFLLWKGRIYLDSKGEKVSQVELPLGIKFSTEFPVLVLFLFGGVLLGFPVYYSRNICPMPSLHQKMFPEMVKLRGKVQSPAAIDVYAVVATQPKTRSDVILNVPFSNESYRIAYVYNDTLSLSDPIALTHDESQPFRTIEVQATPTPTPNLPEIHTVDPQKLDEFKNEVAKQ